MRPSAVEAKLGVDDLVEALAGGGEILHAVAGPFDRRAELPRGGADENLLGIERAFAAEAAADIRRDHAQLMAGHVERRRTARRARCRALASPNAASARRGPASYSARQARGSIATGVLRCMRKRPLTRTGAASHRRIDVAALELAR